MDLFFPLSTSSFAVFVIKFLKKPKIEEFFPFCAVLEGITALTAGSNLSSTIFFSFILLTSSFGGSTTA